jgi:hypothetical protein
MENQSVELYSRDTPPLARVTNIQELDKSQDIVILKNVERPLDDVPHHHSVNGIKRHYCEGFPYHMAIHHISENSSNEFSSSSHNHNADEVNILISDEELIMEYEINGKRFIAEAPCSVVIKKNRYHKSRIVRGKGTFICLILTDTKNAYQL